ncbi:MAG: MBL fold metallo-hydrolase [Salinisphaeraceae bacterium]
MGRRSLPLLAALLTTGCAADPRWQGPPSDHFDGTRFFNPAVEMDRGVTDVLRYLVTRDPGAWGKLQARSFADPPMRVDTGELRITVVGHATVLIQADGLNILTDPVWSDAIGPWPVFGVERMRPPTLSFEQLPPIDVVLISHNHYDHLDLPTIERLAADHAPLFVVPPGDRPLLADAGADRITELDWHQTLTLPNGRTLHALPCVHWSGRLPSPDRNLSLWSAYTVDTAGGPVYFGGDTAYGDHFREAGERLGPFRLALLPIGAYQPRWLVRRVHMNPDEAVAAHRELGAARSIGMHFGTFELSSVGQFQPIDDLARARRDAGVPQPAFTAANFGVGVPIPPLSSNQE